MPGRAGAVVLFAEPGETALAPAFRPDDGEFGSAFDFEFCAAIFAFNQERLRDNLWHKSFFPNAFDLGACDFLVL